MEIITESTQELPKQLETLILYGIYGSLEVDELEAGLENIARQATGKRFDLRTSPNMERGILFWAGSWAVSQLYGSRHVGSAVIIIGETDEGLKEIVLSPFDNDGFVILSANH